MNVPEITAQARKGPSQENLASGELAKLAGLDGLKNRPLLTGSMPRKKKSGYEGGRRSFVPPPRWDLPADTRRSLESTALGIWGRGRAARQKQAILLKTRNRKKGRIVGRVQSSSRENTLLPERGLAPRPEGSRDGLQEKKKSQGIRRPGKEKKTSSRAQSFKHLVRSHLKEGRDSSPERRSMGVIRPQKKVLPETRKKPPFRKKERGVSCAARSVQRFEREEAGVRRHQLIAGEGRGCEGRMYSLPRRARESESGVGCPVQRPLSPGSPSSGARQATRGQKGGFGRRIADINKESLRGTPILRFAARWDGSQDRREGSSVKRTASGINYRRTSRKWMRGFVRPWPTLRLRSEGVGRGKTFSSAKRKGEVRRPQPSTEGSDLPGEEKVIISRIRASLSHGRLGRLQKFGLNSCGKRKLINFLRETYSLSAFILLPYDQATL